MSKAIAVFTTTNNKTKTNVIVFIFINFEIENKHKKFIKTEILFNKNKLLNYFNKLNTYTLRKISSY
jgi:hypothetical protein